MDLQKMARNRVLCLRAAARRLRIPERTLRYQAGRGRIPGAFKQGKWWKFPLAQLENQSQNRSVSDRHEMRTS